VASLQKYPNNAIRTLAALKPPFSVFIPFHVSINEASFLFSVLPDILFLSVIAFPIVIKCFYMVAGYSIKNRAFAIIRTAQGIPDLMPGRGGKRPVKPPHVAAR